MSAYRKWSLLKLGISHFKLDVCVYNSHLVNKRLWSIYCVPGADSLVNTAAPNPCPWGACVLSTTSECRLLTSHLQGFYFQLVPFWPIYFFIPWLFYPKGILTQTWNPLSRRTDRSEPFKYFQTPNRKPLSENSWGAQVGVSALGCQASILFIHPRMAAQKQVWPLYVKDKSMRRSMRHLLWGLTREKDGSCGGGGHSDHWDPPMCHLCWGEMWLLF